MVSKQERRAAKAAVRKESGEECLSPAGYLRPVVDMARCEAKHCCEVICPFEVFDVRKIEWGDYWKLPALAKVKVFVHGMKTAYTPNADACRACMLCVEKCPEDAIELKRWREVVS